MNKTILLFCAIVNAQSMYQFNYNIELWQINSLATIDTTVGSQTDLFWSLQSQVQLQKNDCIQIEIPNPYAPDSYTFFAQNGVVSCSLDSQVYQCSVISSNKFQILVTGAVQQTATLLQGKSTGNIFKNPYSTRRIQDVTVTYFSQCNINQALVKGQTKLPSFFPQNLPNVNITSSSQIIGAKNATLILQFKPQSNLVENGSIQIKSPPWYQQASLLQQGVNQNSFANTMISEDGSVIISVKSGQIVTTTNISFDSSTSTLNINYNSQNGIMNTEIISVQITLFHNPVDQNQVSGFQVTTTDSQGYQIDQSTLLQLQTQINIPQKLNEVTIQFLGDQNQQNIGMISTLQSMYFSFSMIQPLQPFCYFVLTFPSQLQLGQNVQNIIGSGIFVPYENSNNLDTGQYSVDIQNNELKIEGCRLPDSLSENPYGSITVNLVKLPDYVQDIPSIDVKVYADSSLLNLVVSDPNSSKINGQSLTPGLFKSEMFKPSNFYASATKVAYFIYVRPQHGITPKSRIIIDMPSLLTFNRSNGCSVVLTICNCSIDPIKNTLTLTNIFNTNLAGGNLIKFMILEATNPMGSRQSGAWSIRSETPINGVYYVVDGQKYPESFFALSGSIYSSLDINNLQVSSNQTSYNFSIKTEHGIPANGKLLISFPKETFLSPNIIVQGLQDYQQQGNNITVNYKFAVQKDTQISFTVLNVQNARSMQPSSVFYLATLDSNDFVIDSGGQDIVVTPNAPAYFSNVNVVNLNTTNGALTTLNISVTIDYPIFNNDILHLELPPEIIFQDPVNCTHGTYNLSCTHSDRVLEILFKNISQTVGLFSIFVSGVKNPTSLQPSSPFIQFYTTDNAGFKSQQISAKNILTLQTQLPAIVQQYSTTQGTQEYGLEGSLTLQFMTMNPINPSGVMILNWPDSVTLFNNTYCLVTTFKQILAPDVCLFNIEKRQIIIQNAFIQMTNFFSGQIQIYLSRVKNPITNENLASFTLNTYNDPALQYLVDQLYFQPKLKCFWSCQLCGNTKDYCTQCWPDKKKFLHQYNWQSSCLDNCPNGWTSNGTAPPVCQQCDVSCASCQDAGLSGDVGRCLTCAPGYNYFQPVSGNSGLCQTNCSQGFFDNGQGTCLPCSSTCLSCSVKADNCTSCYPKGNLQVLYNSNCIVECPEKFTDIVGICYKCVSPCSQCENSTNYCTQCDGINGFQYRFGTSCVTQCPEGARLDTVTKVCTGCLSGCQMCDFEHPETCEKCADGYLIFKGLCYTSCPSGSIQQLTGTECRSLSDIDTKLIYFPFLITTIIIGFVSWIGRKIKPNHLVFANFAILLDGLQHIALLVQVILSFSYGTIGIAIASILIWFSFVITIIGFNIVWRRDVVNKDSRFYMYQQHPDNIRSTLTRNILGNTLSWKFYKLLYSRFFGIHINQFKFTHPDIVEKLFYRIIYINCGVTFFPLIILNIIGLARISWGTQLYIMFIENIILCIISIIVGLIEQRKMINLRKSEDQLFKKQNKISSSLKKKPLKMNLSKGLVQNAQRFNFLFLEAKKDELLYVFGGRHCKSDFYDTADKEQDDRENWTWPLTPKKHDDIYVEDPPKPFGISYIDNCYHEISETLKPLDGLGYNKGTQKGGPFDNDLHRADAGIMSDYQNQEIGIDSRINKKQRGRKNRYFRQIDEEDHNTGQALDSDEEGYAANIKSRSEYLDAIREEDEIMKKENEEDDTIDGSKHKINSVQDTSLTEMILNSANGKASNSINKQSSQYKKASKIVTKKIQPDLNLRNFNEFDVLGDFRRDVKGNIIIRSNENGQGFVDLQGHKVNENGYLLDADGDIVNEKGIKMFKDGIIPAVLQLEKYNFNPFELCGNFKGYKQTSDPLSYLKTTDKSGILDAKNRIVNTQGFLIDRDGSIINQTGKKQFDVSQLTKDGQLQNLYNYAGVRFQITDVMGVFKMGENNQIMKLEQKSKNGILFKDLSGHMVNDKGYLINQDGHIVNRKGKVLFKKQELKNGEFAKIFSFSKFNMANVTGQFITGKDGKPLLNIDINGSLLDNNDKKVNQHGFLEDFAGNIVDKMGNIVFEKEILEDGRPPALFKSKFISGSLQSDDELSQLLHQIEGDSNFPIKKINIAAIDLKKNVTGQRQQFGVGGNLLQKKLNSQREQAQKSLAKEQSINQRRKSKDSSYGSEMDDQPSNPNSKLKVGLKRIKDIDQNLSGNNLRTDSKSTLRGSTHRMKKVKLNRAMQLIKVEQMFESDVKMAHAYGGEAVPRVRLIPKRFATSIRERPQFAETSRDGMNKNPSGQQQSFNQNAYQTNSEVFQENQELRQNIPNSPSNQAFTINDRAQMRRKLQNETKEEKKNSEIEKELAELYKQDVDKYIDGSNFEVNSLSGFSELSGGSFISLQRHQKEQSKAKQLENEYLRKLEDQKFLHKQQVEAHLQKTAQ